MTRTRRVAATIRGDLASAFFLNEDHGPGQFALEDDVLTGREARS